MHISLVDGEGVTGFNIVYPKVPVGLGTMCSWSLSDPSIPFGDDFSLCKTTQERCIRYYHLGTPLLFSHEFVSNSEELKQRGGQGEGSVPRWLSRILLIYRTSRNSQGRSLMPHGCINEACCCC